MSDEWSTQEREDLLDYQSSINALIKEGLVSRERGMVEFKRAMLHTRFQRHEELDEDTPAPVQKGPVDLKWLFEQDRFDRYAAYMFWLYEWFGTWDEVAAYLGVHRRAAIRTFKRRASVTPSPCEPAPSSPA